MANYNNKATYNIGDEYGYWTIIGDSDKHGYNNSTYVKCKCICGKIKDVDFSNLKRGNSKSCGCIKPIKKVYKYNINVGDVFGKLTVLENIKGNDRAKYKCLCECGNTTVTTGYKLYNGITKSCGCLRINTTNAHKNNFKKSFKDWCLENDLEYILNLWDYDLNKCSPENVGFKSGREFYFKCPNGLHESEKFQIANSVNNFLQSGYFFICRKCMHQSSQAEEFINNFLYNFGYTYERQYRFDDCKDNKLLPFDFYLPDFNIAIEYDGEQHYFPVNFGYYNEDIMIEKFDTTKKHDIIKNKYCKANKIKLIRIPYYKIDEYEDIGYFLWDKLIRYGAIEEVKSI